MIHEAPPVSRPEAPHSLGPLRSGSMNGKYFSGLMVIVLILFLSVNTRVQNPSIGPGGNPPTKSASAHEKGVPHRRFVAEAAFGTPIKENDTSRRIRISELARRWNWPFDTPNKKDWPAQKPSQAGSRNGLKTQRISIGYLLPTNT